MDVVNNVIDKGVVCLTLAVADRNGASKMFYSFARALVYEGYTVKVFYGRAVAEGSYLAELNLLGVVCKSITILRCPVPPLSHHLLARECEGALAIIGFHQRDRAAAISAARLLNIAGFGVIGNSHYFWGLFAKFKEYYYKRCLSSLDKGMLICTSSKVKSELIGRFGIKSDETVVLENGIELMPLINRSQKPENAPLKFITVGRLDYQKGLDVLLSAWAESSAPSLGHTLQIVGGETPGNLNGKSKTYSTELNRIVSDRGLTECVEFLGVRDDVTDLLRDADVYILSLIHI